MSKSGTTAPDQTGGTIHDDHLGLEVCFLFQNLAEGTQVKRWDANVAPHENGGGGGGWDEMSKDGVQ